MAEAVAHRRAQLQLQQHVFQLALEAGAAGGLAQVLSAWPQHDGGGRQGQRRGGPEGGGGSDDDERLIACGRLVHALLVKGAWNRRCCVAEAVEEEGAAGMYSSAGGDLR